MNHVEFIRPKKNDQKLRRSLGRRAGPGPGWEPTGEPLPIHTNFLRASWSRVLISWVLSVVLLVTPTFYGVGMLFAIYAPGTPAPIIGAIVLAITSLPWAVLVYGWHRRHRYNMRLLAAAEEDELLLSDHAHPGPRG